MEIIGRGYTHAVRVEGKEPLLCTNEACTAFGTKVDHVVRLVGDRYVAFCTMCGQENRRPDAAR